MRAINGYVKRSELLRRVIADKLNLGLTNVCCRYRQDRSRVNGVAPAAVNT
jgi:hypothetical protein